MPGKRKSTIVCHVNLVKTYHVRVSLGEAVQEYTVLLTNSTISTLAPLTELLRAGVKYVWSLCCQQAFDKVRHLLSTAPVLVVFVQADDKGIERLISYVSRKF